MQQGGLMNDKKEKNANNNCYIPSDFCVCYEPYSFFQR